MIPVRPILRWAGSKKQLLKELSNFWPGEPTRYIEPFAGSACLFFHLLPSEAILGDLNSDLIAMYRNIRFDVDRVLECLRRLPTGKRSYYRIRAVSPRSLTEPERAARFIYLNKYCFNGLYRTNLDGVFNVPFGDTKGRDSIDELAIRNAARVLHNIHLIAGDFQRTLSLARPGDFVYLDPPYSVSHRRSFAEYQPAVFDDSELRRLNDSLEDLDSRNISFLVSYAESAEARILTSRWRWRTVSIRRSIAGFASHRSSINEILASNIGRELG